MKVVFMGTPDFAVNTLDEIIKSGHEVAAVVTQPDKAQGRSGALKMPPVKELAVANNIPVYQPEKIRTSDMDTILTEIAPDVIVVVAFGQILPKTILDIPKYGCINVHASLLPKYRGAAPIQWAVINGDEYSGVTTMKLGDGPVDSGDVLLMEKYKLAEDETGGSLFDKLADLGAKLLIRTLAGLEDGTVVPTPQEGEIVHVGKLDKNMGILDFDKTAIELERLVRGLNPWPSAFTKLDGKTLKIWKAEVSDINGAEPGRIVAMDKNSFTISTCQGGLKVLELQLEGKKRMDAGAFLRGYQVELNTKLGEEA